MEGAPPVKKVTTTSATPVGKHAVENRKKKDREQKKKLEKRIADAADFAKVK